MAREKDKERVSVKCAYCDRDYTVSYGQYRRKGKENHKWKCRKCAMELMSDEDKAKRSKKIRNVLGDKSPEEKAEMTRKRLITIDNDEFRANKKAKVQKAWSNKSADDLKAISEKASANTTKVWANMDPEVKKKRLKKGIDALGNWYANLSPEEKMLRNKETSERLIEFWNKASPLYRIEHGRNSIKWRDDLTIEEIKEQIRKARAAVNPTKLEKKFQSIFESSGLTNIYKLVNEDIQYRNGVFHPWDFGIYDQNDQLVMLVDLDGVYYHGDICDYDGAHGLFISDEKRWVSIPDGAKVCIIYEKNFDTSYKYMLDMLNLSYEGYLNYRFKMLRKIPFPTPFYNEKDLVKSFNDLECVDKNEKDYKIITDQRRLGMNLIYNFHPSIWNDIEPYWWDDEWLMEHLRSNQIYHSHQNPNKLLIGFHRDIITPLAYKLIIDKYVDGNSILNLNGDPSLTLAIAATHKQHAGTMSPETDRMVQFLIDKFKVENFITDRYDTIIAHIQNDNEAKEIMQNYQCPNYIFLINDTEMEVIDIIINRSYFSTGNLNVVKIRR